MKFVLHGRPCRKVGYDRDEANVGDHLILYDGVCGLCNRMNQFVLARDREAVFDFASLQSATGKSWLRQAGRSAEALDTFYVVERYRSQSPVLRGRSDGALFVAGALKGSVGWLRAFGLLPRSWRDALYDVVAGNRYRFFGRSDVCMMPSPSHRSRFIDI